MIRAEMTTTTEASPLDPHLSVSDLVAARPSRARVFEKLGIDYCCGGKRPLADACRSAGLDPVAVVAELRASDAPADDTVDAAALSLTALADHIELAHHAYLKHELPRLVEMAERVARKHAWRDSRLVELGALVRQLAEEMFSHLQKEEMILFPLVREIEAGNAAAATNPPCGSLADPIRQMEAEHEFAGRVTARLRELTDGFTPDANACNTHRALLGGLAEFEADLQRHVHKENNVLFPRALALASAN